MRNVVGRFWFLCGFAGLLPVSAIAQNATFSLIPVGAFSRECVGGPREGQSCTTTSDCEVFPECDRVCKGGENAGQPCAVALDCLGAPCEQKCFCNYVITASPGDEIVTEILGSNWSPRGQHLLSWGFRVEGEVFGDTTAMPKGVDNPQFDCLCFVDADCTECDEGRAPACWDLRLICASPDHDPTVGAFIDIARSDYVFFGCIDFPTVDLASHTDPGYRYGSTVFLDPTCAPVYNNVPKYFGTLKLIVQDDACDPFTVSIQSSSGSTHMIERERVVFLEPLDTEGLTVNVVGECPCDEIISMTPAECSVDPRQPSEPNGTPLYGWDSMELMFRLPGCRTETLGLENFAVTQIPSGFPRIGIASLEPNGRFLTVRFSRIIVPERWTCLDFFPDGGGSQRLCLGSLPGDADDDREALAAEDVPSIVDCVDETEVPCDTLRCDMDRSGRCAPADILRVIDLLQGADAYAPGFEDAMLSTSECAPVLGAALFSPDLTGTDSDRSSRRNTGRRQRR